MDARLAALTERDGVFLRRDVLRLGYDDRTIRLYLRRGHWHRVRHGAYTLAATWDGADAVQRHRLRSAAVLRTNGRGAALSHVSALVAHGVETYDLDLDRVHLTRLDARSGARTRDVVHHEGLTTPEDLCQVGDHRATVPARALVETATTTTAESALVSLDAALREGLVTGSDLQKQAARASSWPGSLPLEVLLSLADGRAASATESRARFLFWAHGLPRPRLAFPIRDATGTSVGSTAFAWVEHRLLCDVVERSGTPSEDFCQLRREERLRETTGFNVVRVAPEDLDQPDRTVARVRRFLRRSA